MVIRYEVPHGRREQLDLVDVPRTKGLHHDRRLFATADEDGHLWSLHDDESDRPSSFLGRFFAAPRPPYNRPMRIALAIGLLTLPSLAERVTFETADGVRIAGTFHAAAKDAPTIICLPMYRHERKTYDRLVAPVVLKGINVLAIDLRGHGDSAPELADRVKNRDATLFNAMHEDVAAAVRFLEEKKGCDRTRLGIVGASVGCSVAVDYTCRHPGDVRAVVLLTPGSKYLGVDTKEHLAKWPGTAVFTFTSTEEKETSKEVMEMLGRFDGSSHMVVPGEGIHGTRMFGKVTSIEELIANFLESRLSKSADLRPHANLVLRRGKVSVRVGPKSVAVEGGKATIRVDGKRSSVEPGEPLAWTWKKGAKLRIEVRPEKGPKLRFPSKGEYALMPLLDDG